MVDTRSPAEHARRHVPGSLSIPAGPSFGTWLGWVVEADAPIVLIVDDPADLDDLARQAIRIGCETIEGYVDGGFEGWARSGRPVEDGAAIDVDDLAAALSAGGSAGAARHRCPPAVRVRGGPRARRRSHRRGRAARRSWTGCRTTARSPLVCASGYRSSIAASLLRAGGFSRVAAVAGGTPDWEAHGYPLDYGAGTDGLDWPATPAAPAHSHDG